MTDQQQPGTHAAFADCTRPTGVVSPSAESAKRALRALAEHRLTHAEENIEAITLRGAAEDVWTAILQGMLQAARLNFPTAEQYMRGALLDLQNHTSDEKQVLNPYLPRVSAFANHQLGIVHRRQDRPKAAYDAHLAAYRHRDEFGSFEELWESALALGIDLDLAGDHADGQNWFRTAIAAAARAEETPAEKQAVAWTHLAESLLQEERWQDAVQAAVSARSWWHAPDISAPSAARADMRLGHAVLRHGAALLESGAPTAGESLTEALRILREVRESFEAFGAAFVADRAYCDEQIDFAERLIASLENVQQTPPTGTQV